MPAVQPAVAAAARKRWHRRQCKKCYAPEL